MKPILIALLLCGVGCAADTSGYVHPLSGEHRLRKMIQAQEVTGSAHGNFFLFSGSLVGVVQSGLAVTFSWQLANGDYALSSLPISRVRIRLDDTCVQPTVRFRWRDGERPFDGNLMWPVIYALITARSEDWPTQITLPLNTPAGPEAQ